MTTKNGWRYPINDGGVNEGINDGNVYTFKGSKLITNVTREIIQNSIDAAAGEKAVVVEFDLHKLKKNDYPELSGIATTIEECIEYWEKYSNKQEKLKRFLAEAKETMSQPDVEVLIARDFNTKGLQGADAPNIIDTPWASLTNGNGITNKDEGAGGSYGIGKNAPFACSTVRSVFYNSFSKEDKVKAFIGVSKLVTHEHNEEKRHGTGFYYDMVEKRPIYNDNESPLRDYLGRNEYGTDVVVVGFKQNENWQEDVEKAVLSNFFVAINNKSLIVRIGEREINDINILARLEYYAKLEEGSGSDNEMSVALELFHAVKNADYHEVGMICGDEENVDLYIAKNDSYSRTIAETRATGMVISKRHRNIYSHYAAVAVVRKGKLNNILQSMEPPAHDKWDAGIIEDEEKQKEAKKARQELIHWINATVTECCKAELSDEIDLDGISAYLPFDDDDPDLGINGEGENDSLDADTRAGETEKTKRKAKTRTITYTGKRTRGNPDDRKKSHNESKGGKGKGTGGDPDPDGEGVVTVPGDGSDGRTISVPKVKDQRVMMMPANSMYKVYFVLEEDCPTAQISLRALGDDGRPEPVKIESMKIDRTTEKIEEYSAQLVDLKANVPCEVFLNLEYDEKLTMELIVE